MVSINLVLMVSLLLHAKNRPYVKDWPLFLGAVWGPRCKFKDGRRDSRLDVVA